MLNQTGSTGNALEMMLSQEKAIKKQSIHQLPKLTQTDSEQYALKQEEMLMPKPKGKEAAPSVSGDSTSYPGFNFMLIPKFADKKNGSPSF